MLSSRVLYILYDLFFKRQQDLSFSAVDIKTLSTSDLVVIGRFPSCFFDIKQVSKSILPIKEKNMPFRSALTICNPVNDLNVLSTYK